MKPKYFIVENYMEYSIKDIEEEFQCDWEDIVEITNWYSELTITLKDGTRKDGFSEYEEPPKRGDNYILISTDQDFKNRYENSSLILKTKDDNG